MTCDEIIDGILARKEVLNTTNQQIADASNVPKTTVDRILRKETQNPSIIPVLAIAEAVGYDFSQQEEIPVEATDEKLQQIIYIYEKRCEALEKESRLKTVQSNLVIAEKDRRIADKDKWIARLFSFLMACLLILLLDVLIRGIGWFP